jgi:hypothetical protein
MTWRTPGNCDVTTIDGPFPFGYIDDYLDPESLSLFTTTFLDPASHADVNVLGKGKRRLMFRAPPVPAIVADAGPAWAEAITHLAGRDFMGGTWDWVRGVYEGLDLPEPYAALVRERCRLDVDDLVLQMEFSSLETGAHLPPHTDAPDKLISCVLYLPDSPWDAAWGGETVAYRPLDETRVDNWCSRSTAVDGMRVIGAVPFVPNRMFWFVKTHDSWHGVTPVTAPPGVGRRSFNVSLAIRPEALARPALATLQQDIEARESALHA